MARRWIKLWVQESLTGTIRFDFTSEERGVWYDLLALAGSCRLEGVIAAGENTPYPGKWIAGILNINESLLNRTLEKCIKTGRIEENGAVLRIVNWDKYQSEYERQKPYRQAKKSGVATFKKCPSCDYKGKTAENDCPACGGELQKDFTAGKYGHMVNT